MKNFLLIALFSFSLILFSQSVFADCVNPLDTGTWTGKVFNGSDYDLPHFRMIVGQSIVICPGTYNLPAFENSTQSGVVFIVAVNDTVLDCNGSSFIGDGKGGFAEFIMMRMYQELL